MNFCFRAVYRNLIVVDAQAVALRITVNKKPALQEFVRGKTDTGYYVGRGEGRLFHFRKKVLRVSVKFQNADFVERILAMPPDFCDVERIFVVFEGLFFCHDLYIHCPARIIASFNRFIQISAMAFPVFGDEGFRFRVRKVFDSLLGFKVELAPYTFIFIIL